MSEQQETKQLKEGEGRNDGDVSKIKIYSLLLFIFRVFEILLCELPLIISNWNNVNINKIFFYLLIILSVVIKIIRAKFKR